MPVRRHTWRSMTLWYWTSLADVLRTVREKAPNTELVLTGRGAPEELIALADYVSVIEARKHPFADGARTAAREGVEY